MVEARRACGAAVRMSWPAGGSRLQPPPRAVPTPRPQTQGSARESGGDRRVEHLEHLSAIAAESPGLLTKSSSAVVCRPPAPRAAMT